MNSKIAEFDFIVVGAGFFGSTMAQKIAESGKRVLIIDKRDHIGGNAYSYKSTSASIEVHKYGTHIFHTNVTSIWEYINQFGNFNDYVHKVTTISQGEYLPIPINMETLVKVLGTDRAKKFVEGINAGRNELKHRETLNLRDWCILNIGSDLYERVIAGYTQKQWGIAPELLPSSIISRLPVRTDHESNYFSDIYQGVPLDGYEKIVLNQISHPNISIDLECDFFEIKEFINSNQIVIYTGPIDKFFGYSKGQLGWRTLDFDVKTLPMENFQSCAVQNYADLDVPYTRIHEFKHLQPEKKFTNSETVVSYEYSRFASVDDEPYYPINTGKDRNILVKYREMTEKENNYFFGGRLGSYQYLDMHMAIGQALKLFSNLVDGGYIHD